MGAPVTSTPTSERASPWDGERLPDGPALDRWAACLGVWVSLASLAIVGLADFSIFHLGTAVAAIAASLVVAAAVTRPRLHIRRPSRAHLLAALVLAVGAAAIAPGSENIAGP